MTELCNTKENQAKLDNKEIRNKKVEYNEEKILNSITSKGFDRKEAEEKIIHEKDNFKLVYNLEEEVNQHALHSVITYYQNELRIRKEQDKLKVITHNNTKESFNFRFQTTHMPMYDNLSEVISLYGEEYVLSKKIISYSLIGGIIAEPMRYGSTLFDTRVNITFMMNSNKGKGNIKRVYVNSIPFTHSICRPVSTHPEQLIGKVVPIKDSKGNKIPTQIPGYFDINFIIFDESKHLFNSFEQKHKETRQHICTATDAMGTNLIHKQMVEYGSNTPLSYYAKCTIIFLTQPVKIIKDATNDGFLRRSFIINCESNGNIEEIYTKRLEETNIQQYTDDFKKFLEVHKGGINTNWQFDNIKESLKKYSLLLYNFGLSHSEKGALYTTKLYSQQHLDNLLKFSCITAIYRRNEKKVTTDDVEIAYMDLMEITNEHLNNINLYCENFNEFKVDYNKLYILKWLYNCGATNEFSEAISINSLRQKMMEIYGISFNGTNPYYGDLKNEEMIKTKKGQHDSCVWITPKALKLIQSSKYNPQKDFNAEFYKEYIRICDKFGAGGVQSNETYRLFAWLEN